MKRIRAKCINKDKDKSSTLDSYNNTKSSAIHRTKHINTSGRNTYTETTPTSQILCDLSYKEYSAFRTSTPKIPQIHEIQSPPITNRASPKTKRRKALEFLKIPESKDIILQNLEKVRTSVGDEINEAVDYFTKNREIANVLSEKDRTIKELTIQLHQKSKEVERLESWKRFRSTPNIADSSKIFERHSSKQEDFAMNCSTYRVTSPSPRFDDLSLQKQEKYKMYREDLLKPLQAKSVKAKTHRGQMQQLPLPHITKTSNKYMEAAPSTLSTSKTTGHIQVKKSCLATPRLKTPSPKKVIFKLKNLAETNRNRGNDAQKESSRRLDQRDIDKKSKLTWNDQDISKSYSSLMGQFISMIEKYKNTTEALNRKNRDLERRFEKFDKKEDGLNHS